MSPIPTPPPRRRLGIVVPSEPMGHQIVKDARGVSIASLGSCLLCGERLGVALELGTLASQPSDRDVSDCCDTDLERIRIGPTDWEWVRIIEGPILHRNATLRPGDRGHHMPESQGAPKDGSASLGACPNSHPGTGPRVTPTGTWDPPPGARASHSSTTGTSPRDRDQRRRRRGRIVPGHGCERPVLPPTSRRARRPAPAPGRADLQRRVRPRRERRARDRAVNELVRRAIDESARRTGVDRRRFLQGRRGRGGFPRRVRACGLFVGAGVEAPSGSPPRSGRHVQRAAARGHRGVPAGADRVRSSSSTSTPTT